MRSAVIAALTIGILNTGFVSAQEPSGGDERVVPSDIGPFNTEWCSRNALPKTSRVKEICFGWVEVGQTDSTRALTFMFEDGRIELYIETGFSGVDPFRFNAHLLGPILVDPATPLEEGEATLSIGQDGEVDAVHVRSPRLGYAIAFRKN